MGINLCVYDQNDREHPTWDHFRYAGDRDFAPLAYTLPRKETDAGIRPTDFEAWRTAIKAQDWHNGPQRYLDLVDLLEREPTFYLYVSW